MVTPYEAMNGGAKYRKWGHSIDYSTLIETVPFSRYLSKATCIRRPLAENQKNRVRVVSRSPTCDGQTQTQAHRAVKTVLG